MHRPTLHRMRFGLAAVLIAASGLASAADPFAEVLDSSLKDKKGVVIYVKGQALSGRVTKVAADVVEMTSRESTRIVIKRDSIDAVAGS